MGFIQRALPSAMQIFVKALDGRTIVLEVEAAETVDDVKCRIYEDAGIPNSQQGLTFAGKTLADDLTLSECGVTKESELSLHMCMRGGCFMFSIALICLIILALCCVPFSCGTSLLVIPFLLPPLFILPCCCL